MCHNSVFDFAPAKNLYQEKVTEFSAGGAAESSPQRELWVQGNQWSKPRQGRQKIVSQISFAPSGLHPFCI